MSTPISVPLGFINDFLLVCERFGTPDDEREDLREKIRADFNDWGVAVQRMAAILRFVDRTWGGVMPSAEQCATFLSAARWFPADPLLLDRLSQLELVELCGQVDGAIPGPIQHAHVRFGCMRDVVEYRALEEQVRAELGAAA